MNATLVRRPADFARADSWHCASEKKTKTMGRCAVNLLRELGEKVHGYEITQRPARDQKGRPFTDYVVVIVYDRDETEEEVAALSTMCRVPHIGHYTT